MAHTNNTTFLNLPLFIGTDKPAWLTDFNSAMQAIDNNASSQKSDIDANALAIAALQTAVNALHPVGSIYMSVNSTNPGSIFGGTWARIKDTFLLAAGDDYAPNSTGGSATHTLTVEEMPAHKHWTSETGRANNVRAGSDFTVAVTNVTGIEAQYTTSSVGGGQAHNNMPPYIAVYVWQRTA